MKPWQDETLLAMCHRRVVDPKMPIDPIVDRCIEMAHHTYDMDSYSIKHSLVTADNRGEIIILLNSVCSEVNDRLFDLGHQDLADMLPF